VASATTTTTAQSLGFASLTVISIKPKFWNILWRDVLFMFGPEALFSPALELAGQVGLDSICS
jgi:hypothetical protein